MKTTPLLLAAALALALAITPWAAKAQASALPDIVTPASAPAAASAAPSAKPGPRLPTPEEKRDRATGELRPERPVEPQIKIPFGKGAAPPAKVKPGQHAPLSGNPASAGGVDDAAARCEAQTSNLARTQCRGRLARE